MSEEIIHRAEKLTGDIVLPGDKSISHRALMLGAIAEGETTIANLSPGKDVQSTRLCLEAMGVAIRLEGGLIHISGRGPGGLTAPDGELDCGNSGTTMRLLSGILAAQPFPSRLTGDASLSRRPMKRIVTPLSMMGAHIETGPGHTPPLTLHGGALVPIDYVSPVASAQIKSCVLLAGLYARGRTSVSEPARSRDHTERMLEAFGTPVHIDGLRVSVEGPARLKGTRIDIPGDMSSAAYFMVAAAMIPGSEIRIRRVNLNPTRTGIMKVLREMGVRFTEENHRTVNGEPVADIIVKSARLKATAIKGDLIPQLIDEIPLLAIAATRAEGITSIRNARELRVKETDRIRTVGENLKKMGVSVEMVEDGFVIPGGQSLTGTILDSYGDHRVAMSFAVAGMIAEGKTIIRDAGCAEISFPGFYDKLRETANESFDAS